MQSTKKTKYKKLNTNTAYKIQIQIQLSVVLQGGGRGVMWPNPKEARERDATENQNNPN